MVAYFFKRKDGNRDNIVAGSFYWFGDDKSIWFSTTDDESGLVRLDNSLDSEKVIEIIARYAEENLYDRNHIDDALAGKADMRDVLSLGSDIDGVRNDMESIKDDVESVKDGKADMADVLSLGSDIEKVRDDMSLMDGEIRSAMDGKADMTDILSVESNLDRFKDEVSEELSLKASVSDVNEISIRLEGEMDDFRKKMSEDILEIITDSDFDAFIDMFTAAVSEDVRNTINIFKDEVYGEIDGKASASEIIRIDLSLEDIESDISSIRDEISSGLDSKVDKAYMSEVEDAVSAALDEISETVDGKQDRLMSGINIKTINNRSIIGKGNIEIETQALRWRYI